MDWIAITFSHPQGAASTSRVGAWRRLKRLGALSPSHGLYVLPRRDSCIEAVQWLAQEVQHAGGEAVVMFVEAFSGLDDNQLVARFRDDADERYGPLAQRLEELRSRLAGTQGEALLSAEAAADLGRAQAELDGLSAVDYFESAGGREAAGELARLRELLAQRSNDSPSIPRRELHGYRGRVWVTRPRPHVDRVACAWLIRRFIDAGAEIRYRTRPQAGEVPFDMTTGEFQHVGNRCTFEVMVESLGLDELGLRPITEIVHELDLLDGRYSRPESSGIAAVLDGWHAARLEDAEIERSAVALFDALYARFAQQARVSGGRRPASSGSRPRGSGRSQAP